VSSVCREHVSVHVVVLCYVSMRATFLFANVKFRRSLRLRKFDRRIRIKKIKEIAGPAGLQGSEGLILSTKACACVTRIRGVIYYF